MSKPSEVAAQAIPTGILVSVSGEASEPERPAPKRKAVKRERAMQVPWLWIVTGGSVSWALIILVIGVCASNGDSSPSVEPSLEVNLIARASLPTPREAPRPTPTLPPAPMPAISNEAPEAEATATASVEPPLHQAEAPKLPVVVPPIEVVRVEPKPDVTPIIEQPQPQPVKVVKAPPPRVKPIQADPTVFASCEQIGSNILFMKSPPEAFKKARDEKKLVFIIHLSGNLEDPGFT